MKTKKRAKAKKRAAVVPNMKEYCVSWDIEVLALNARDAARKALEIQRDTDSLATVFEVTEVKADPLDYSFETIDLSQPEG